MLESQFKNVEFGDLVATVRAQGKLQTSQYAAAGHFPIVDQGKNLIAGYTDDASCVVKHVPLTVFGDHTRTVKFVEFEFAVGADGTKLLRPAQEGADARYFSYVTEFAAAQINSLGYSRHYALLRETIVPYTSCTSSQKYIAMCLSTWDDAIDLAGRLIAAKNEFIRGILAGSVSDAREVAKNDGWEKTTIGDAATLVQQRVTWDEEATYRLITVRRGCGGLIFRGDRKGHEILTKDMYTVRAGDFLISKRQVVHGAWAMVPPEFDGGHVSKEYACLRAKPGKLWMPYFDWLSRTERLQHEAFISSYGVDIEKMVLNVDWLLQTPLLLPRSIETQKAMAAGLDCLQHEVRLLQAQREALSRQRRGLMQKLLTGEWRVPVRDGDVDAVATRVAEEAAQ
jgi:hypothetical protein